MADRSRLATLRLIQRIQRHEVEATGAALAELRLQQSNLEAESAALTERATQEAVNITEETLPYLSGFLTSVAAQQEVWAERQAELAQGAEEKEAALLESFRASKKTEIVLDRTLQSIKQDNDRADIAVLDEAGRTMFLAARKAGDKGR